MRNNSSSSKGQANSPYSAQQAFELYAYYVAVKRHFTSKYDYFKYNGKTNVSVFSFENRKDKWHFYKLTKVDDAKGLIVSNIVANPNVWIGDLFSNQAIATHKQWQKTMQSLITIADL